jgi:hypothetical protein
MPVVEFAFVRHHREEVIREHRVGKAVASGRAVVVIGASRLDVWPHIEL